MRIAINGFGRIGRTILRQVLTRPEHGDVEVAVINDIADADMLAYLFRYDSTFGPLDEEVIASDGVLRIGEHAIPVTHSDDLTRLDLARVDVVLECTGIARSSDVAHRGIRAGARSVLISGPSPAADVTVVLGANEAQIGAHRIVSNASCTTNALAPLLKVLDDSVGVENAHMTTIHCYTNSQPLVDAPRDDFARSRAGALSMVPTTSSATHLVDEVLPQLAGRITGAAVRVPVASVSAVDLVVRTRDDVAEDVFPQMLRERVGISPVLGWTDAPLVSGDLRARPESLVIAGPEIRLAGQRQARVFGWYDNEWGFSVRMLDVARLMARREAR
ncbi:type I glyceraldehyde-3-phosphate dehydrogenase [Sedimentitalea arenosa]|uniref:Glyceraldehyde-3-phosphate dehydrogenase n=1 Tax=Sedimentitalea arenosa TaxID=2798803 RepID=A0A8J7ITY7_9RHOB|nr:glyceraldehyde 3-phosphate dehydrogenase NAD-binding domain-containing protein [Arenibacterium arenosum]MBJ6371322.1 glyceraldehyde-3-phosphate dehydrogenase [Arenibacterium arenosum]